MYWLLYEYSSQVIVCLGNTWYKGESRLSSQCSPSLYKQPDNMSCRTDSLIIVLNVGLSVVHAKIFYYFLYFSTHLSAFEVKGDLTRSISLYRLVMFRQVENPASFPGSTKLCACAKLRKTTISFVMSVRLSARTEQLCSHWTDFHEI